MAFSYRQVRDLYDTLSSAGVATKPIDQWSADMNALSGTDLYSEGQHDNILKRGSVGLDRLLEATGLPGVGREFGRGVGQAVGNPEAGARIGEGLPRMTANFAPMLIPGGGWAAGAARLAGLAGLSGAQTYTETGSPVAGALSGLVNAAMPGTAGVAERAVLASTASKPLAFLAGQGAAAGLGEASGFAQDALAGRPFHNPFTTENLLNLTLGQAPFAASHLVSKAFAPAEAQKTVEKAQAQREYRERVPLEEVPDFSGNVTITPKQRDERNARLIQLRNQIKAADETPTPTSYEDKLKWWDEERKIIEETKPQADTVAGIRLGPDYPRLDLIGKEVGLTKSGTQRVIELPDGRRIAYPTAFEPAPEETQSGTRFQVPDGLYHELPPVTPELPTQAQPAGQLFDHVAVLQQAHDAFDKVQSLNDLQKAIVAANTVRESVGLSPLTDGQLRKRMRLLDVDEKAAGKSLVATTRRKIERMQKDSGPAIPGDALPARMEGGRPVVDNLGTVNGQPITGIPRTKEAQPIHDVVNEQAFQATQTQAGKDAFESWPGKATTDLGTEQKRFELMFDEFGPDTFTPASKFTPEEIKQIMLEDFPAYEFDSAQEVTDFIKRPHVQAWLEATRKAVEEGKVHAPAGPPAMSAGPGWLFAAGPYDPLTNTLNFKHKLPKDGQVNAAAFRNMAGLGKPLPEIEMDMYRELVPEAFVGDKVDVRKLYEGLQGKVVVEEKKLGGPVDPARQEYDRIVHELDTRFPGWEAQQYPANHEVAGLVDQLDILSEREHASTGVTRYSFLGPKSEQNMPGYVEGLVRAPTDNSKKTESYDTEGNYRTGDQRAKDAGIKFSGPHFGSEDTNVLAFYRGYMETLPADHPTMPGRKVFHVIEVQSDWAQKHRDDPSARGDEDMATFRKDFPIADHPLLSAYETLALKSAIAHARANGADAIMLSDGETAMMTEGHDRQPLQQGHMLVEGPDLALNPNGPWKATNRTTGESKEFPTAEAAYSWVDSQGQIPQEKGMRLHYDTTLPSAMAKLTGDRGSRVEVGRHEKTLAPTNMQELNDGRATDPAYGSPVFKDENGKPKSQITGRLFDLKKAYSTLDTQGGFTLTEASRSPTITPYVPDHPLMAAGVADLGVARGGHGLVNYLLRSEDPLYVTLAEDLKRLFPEALGRVRAQVSELSGSSFARSNINRETEIHLSHGLLMADAATRDYTVAHELLHGLTIAELNNPTKQEHYDALTDMRERLAEALPAKLKTMYRNAVDSNFIARYGRNEADVREIGDTSAERDVVYALLNNHEMVAQGFSSKPFRDFLSSVKTGKTNGFTKFTNWVRGLLGFGEKVQGTALAEFIGKSEALLRQGEWISDFTNFSERYLEGQGLGPLAKPKAQQALGLVLGSAHGTTPDQLFHQLYVTQTVKSQEFQRADRDLTRMFQEKGEDFANTAQVMDELGLEPSRDGIDQAVLSHLMGVSDIHDVLDVLPDTVSRYVFESLNEYRDVLDTVRAAVSEKNNGLLNVVDPKMIRRPVNEAMKAVDGLLESKRMHEQAVAMIQGLTAIAPDGYAEKWGAVAKAPERPGNVSDEEIGKFRAFMGDLAGDAKGFMKRLDNFLRPPSQLARSSPEAAELISKGYQLQANSTKMAAEGLKAFGTEDVKTTLDQIQNLGVSVDPRNVGSQVTHESVKRMSEALTNPRLERAVNKWMYLNQKEGQKSGKTVLLPDSHPEVQKILAPLSAKERSDVSEILSKQQLSTQVMQAQIMEKMRQESVVNGTLIAGRSNGLKVQQNLDVVQAVMDALSVNRADPAAAAAADAKLRMAESKVDPQGFLDLLKFSQNEVAKHQAWEQYFKDNPAWASGQRYGKYLVKFTKDKKGYTLGAESKEEARRLAKGGTVNSIELNTREGQDNAPVFGPDSAATIQRLRELEDNQLQMLSQVLSPEELQQLRDTSPVRQFETEAAYSGSVPGLRPEPRGLRSGAEELPWLANHFSYVGKASSYWSRRLFRAQARAHLLEKEIAANPELSSTLRTHVENILQPDPQSVAAVRRFVTTWFMGYNPANVLVNSAQPFFTHVAELTSMSGKPIDSYRRVNRALAEVAGHYVKGRQDWKSEEHSRLMKDSVDALEVGLGKYDDDKAAQESVSTNYKRVLAGNKPQTLGQHLSTAAGAYSTAGMWLFQHGEQVNTRAAILAAFDYHREQGDSYETARQKSWEFNRAVNYGGGRANRPVGAFSGRGAFPRGVAMLGTAMQNYVLGTTFQLVRYLQKGLFRPAGVTPHEVYAARKAALQMLGTQLASAGLLGLPFVSGALALLDKAFPDLQLNKKLRENVHDFFSSDKENGNILSDIAMTGAPSMMGWDLQSRLSMGNTLPGVSEINGFQPEALLGPPASLVASFVNGGRRLAQGEGQGALAFVPPAVKKLTELISEGGQVKDFRGRPVFEPTPAETVGVALGFQPKRLSDYNSAQRLAEQSEKVSTRREAQWNQGQAERVLQGDFGTVQQALRSRLQESKDFDAAGAVRAIARSAEELTFPRDLRNEGTVRNASVRQRLLSSFNLGGSSPTEVTRLQFRQQVEQRLGLPASRSGDLQLATVMDQLRAQQPEATRSELRRRAEELTRRTRQPALAFQ